MVNFEIITPMPAPVLRPTWLKTLLCLTHGVAGSSPVQTAKKLSTKYWAFFVFSPVESLLSKRDGNGKSPTIYEVNGAFLQRPTIVSTDRRKVFPIFFVLSIKFTFKKGWKRKKPNHLRSEWSFFAASHHWVHRPEGGIPDFF
jgi:hypothetical protein